jgi:hypothetical protein
MKDKDNRIYETNTMDALAEVVQLLDPTYEQKSTTLTNKPCNDRIAQISQINPVMI